MKNVLHTLKKHWITVWLAIAVVGAVSFFSYAEYIEDSNRAKRVIANTSGAGELFSSDYLVVGSGVDRIIPFDDSEEYVIPVRIWNYDSANPTFFYNSKDITYTLKAQLVKKEGASYVPITSNTALSDPDSNPDTNDSIEISIKIDNDNDTYADFTATPEADRTVPIKGNDSYLVHQGFDDETEGYTVTYTGLKLYKNNRDENKVFIEFPGDMRTSSDKIFVKLTATPTPLADYSGIHALNGYFTITKGKTALTPGWSGRFTDSENLTDYDGFNYVISGNGSATITFKWRSDKLEINPYFLSDNTATIPDEPIVNTVNGATCKTITINANSGTVSRYDIQFYMKDWSDNTVSWNDVKGYVDFTS